MRFRYLLILFVTISIVFIISFFLSKEPKVYLVNLSCEQIISPSFKEICLTILKKDPLECEKLEGGFKTLCYEFVFPISSINHSFCLSFEGYPKRVCFFELAIKEKNPEFCKEDYSGSLKDQCFYNLALKLGKTSICENIDYSELEYQCKAVILKNPDLCKSMHPWVENETIELLICKALATKDLNFCVENGRPEPFCIKELAIYTENPSLCEQIEEERLKGECFSEVIRESSFCHQMEDFIWRDYCLLGYIRNTLKFS